MKITKITKKVLEENYKHGTHAVKWSLFDVKSLDVKKDWSREEAIKLSGNNHTNVCYANLKNNLREGAPKYLFTSIALDAYARSLLSIKEQLQWVRLLKKNKLLPHYIKPSNVVGNGTMLKVMFKLRSINNKQELYIYLGLLRHITEDPGLPKIVLHLVNELKLDFFTAVVVGSYYGVKYSGHSVLPIVAPYPKALSVEKVSFDLQYGKALKLFMKDPKKYGKGTIFSPDNWDVHKTLGKVCGEEFTVSFKDLDKESTTNFINSRKN
jgi:hypothetical protein